MEMEGRGAAVEIQDEGRWRREGGEGSRDRLLEGVRLKAIVCRGKRRHEAAKGPHDVVEVH